MALGKSPGRVREVRFGEQWRGYRTDEVDEFVEQVAATFDQLEEQVRESSRRVADAQRQLAERGVEGELTRTLVLAQRTADAARREAETDATRLVSDAEERARMLVEEGEARRARLDEEIEERIQSELGDIVERRSELERELASMASYVERERGRLAAELRGHLAWLDHSGHLEPLPAPLSSAVDAASPGDGTILDGTDRPTRRADDDDPIVDGGEVVVQEVPEVGTATGAMDAGQPADDQPADDPLADHQPPDDPLADDPLAEDPFISELRRAANDPEPLGPRDDAALAGGWSNDGDVYDEAEHSTRFRRRRKR